MIAVTLSTVLTTAAVNGGNILDLAVFNFFLVILVVGFMVGMMV